MDTNEINMLRNLCLAFRSAILKSNKGALITSLHKFPYGACSDSSLLLARYLIKRGYKNVQYVSGKKADIENNVYLSHAWLELNEYIIDITIDQFGDINEPVLITTDRQIHDMFDNDILRYQGEYYSSVNRIKYWLDTSYKEIMRQLES